MKDDVQKPSSKKDANHEVECYILYNDGGDVEFFCVSPGKPEGEEKRDDEHQAIRRERNAVELNKDWSHLSAFFNSSTIRFVISLGTSS